MELHAEKDRYLFSLRPKDCYCRPEQVEDQEKALEDWLLAWEHVTCECFSFVLFLCLFCSSDIKDKFMCCKLMELEHDNRPSFWTLALNNEVPALCKAEVKCTL